MLIPALALTLKNLSQSRSSAFDIDLIMHYHGVLVKETEPNDQVHQDAIGRTEENIRHGQMPSMRYRI